jgi:hypothetical protein
LQVVIFEADPGNAHGDAKNAQTRDQTNKWANKQQSADSQKLDCFSRFLPLFKVAMVPCRFSYSKLILEMLMLTPKTPNPHIKQTNGQTSSYRQIHKNWTTFLDFCHCAQWLWFLAGCHIRS